MKMEFQRHDDWAASVSTRVSAADTNGLKHMGFFDSLRNVLSQRPSRPEALPPVHVEGAPPLESEHDLALHLLDQPAVAQLFEEQGADIGTVRSQVELGRAEATRESWESLHLVVQTPQGVHADRDVDLLVKLLSLGTDEIRAAFTTPGLKPGDIAFALAHGRPETQLRAEWPAAGTARSTRRWSVFTPR